MYIYKYICARMCVCVVNVLCVVFACNIRSKIYMICVCVCGCLCVKRTCVQLQKRTHIYNYIYIYYRHVFTKKDKHTQFLAKMTRYLDAINICWSFFRSSAEKCKMQVLSPASTYSQQAVEDSFWGGLKRCCKNRSLTEFGSFKFRPLTAGTAARSLRNSNHACAQYEVSGMSGAPKRISILGFFEVE